MHNSELLVVSVNNNTSQGLLKFAAVVNRM